MRCNPNDKSLYSFLLASLQMERILSDETPGDVKITLSKLTSNLDDYYDNAMERIKSIRPQTHSAMALSLLKWISHAQQPLKLVEAQYALEIRLDVNINSSQDHLSFIIDPFDPVAARCAGLVLVRDGNVILAHETVQKYLSTRKSTLFPDADAEISQACLTYLLFEELGSGLAIQMSNSKFG